MNPAQAARQAGQPGGENDQPFRGHEIPHRRPRQAAQPQPFSRGVLDRLRAAEDHGRFNAGQVLQQSLFHGLARAGSRFAQQP